MQPRRFTLPDESSSSPAEKNRFEVVVAFDDSTNSSKSALRTCDYVISKLGGDVPVKRIIVNLNRATSPRSRAAAARDAARADMVIVSTREHTQLPREMQDWLDEWTRQRSAAEGALVAILNKPAIGTRTSTGVRDQLANVARKMHMDFFSSEVAP